MPLHVSEGVRRNELKTAAAEIADIGMLAANPLFQPWPAPPTFKPANKTKTIVNTLLR